jgi:hypothetical protein
MAPHNTHIHSCTGKASTHTNTEKVFDVFTSGNNTVRVQPDIQVHPTDITCFMQVEFNEQINSFVNCSGIHPFIIQDIYKNVSSYKDT